MQWTLELVEFDLAYQPCTTIKAQILADFINELIPVATAEDKEWKLFVDGSTTCTSAGLGVAIMDLTGATSKHAIKLCFAATNNEAKYEVFLVGLRLAKAKGISRLSIFTDSQLLASQLSSDYQAQEPSMRLYVNEVAHVMVEFSMATVHKVPWAENTLVDALAKLASTVPSIFDEPVIMKELHQPMMVGHTILPVSNDKSWLAPIIQYLLTGDVPPEVANTKSFHIMAARYTLVDGLLFKRGCSMPLLHCVDETSTVEILQEAHKRICSTHASHQAMVMRLLRYDYFWPRMRQQTM